MIDEPSVRRWWSLFKEDNPLVEIRVLGGGKKTFSGYFADVESLINAIRQYDGYGIYATINEVKKSCWGRSQTNTILQSPKSTTSDTDIECRTTLLIDIDPKRPSDTNASDDEVKGAYYLATQVYKFLATQGFEKPVVAFSANGYHLLYKIYLANSVENANLVRDFLLALDMLFSNDVATIDTSVFNASRISKLIGTTSNKGVNTAERPQRISSFVDVPDEYKVTDKAYIQKLCFKV